MFLVGSERFCFWSFSQFMYLVPLISDLKHNSNRLPSPPFHRNRWSLFTVKQARAYVSGSTLVHSEDCWRCHLAMLQSQISAFQCISLCLCSNMRQWKFGDRETYVMNVLGCCVNLALQCSVEESQGIQLSCTGNGCLNDLAPLDLKQMHTDTHGGPIQILGEVQSLNKQGVSCMNFEQVNVWCQGALS